MKKILGFLLIVSLFFVTTMSLSSCSRKTGCPSTENAKVKLNKNGMPKKKSKSGLFPKDMRRKRN